MTTCQFSTKFERNKHKTSNHQWEKISVSSINDGKYANLLQKVLFIIKLSRKKIENR